MGKRFMESWSRHFFIFGQIFGIVADNKDASKLSSNMDKIRQNMKKKPDLTCLLNLFLYDTSKTNWIISIQVFSSNFMLKTNFDYYGIHPKMSTY